MGLDQRGRAWTHPAPAFGGHRQGRHPNQVSVLPVWLFGIWYFIMKVTVYRFAGLMEAGTGSTLKGSLCSLSDISDSEEFSNKVSKRYSWSAQSPQTWHLFFFLWTLLNIQSNTQQRETDLLNKYTRDALCQFLLALDFGVFIPHTVCRNSVH